MTLNQTFEIADVPSMLETKAPEPNFLIDKLLPVVPIAAITGQGGVGKSILAMQLSCSIVGGDDFMGMSVSEPGAVLYVSAEESIDEIHRRIDSIVKIDREYFDHNKLKSSLKIVALQPGSCSLFYETSEGVKSTRTYEEVASYAKSIRELKLIVIDTYSAVCDFDENCRTHTSQALDKLRTLHVETGAMILLIHHHNKQGTNNKHSPRGSSAFVNTLRWVSSLSKTTNNLMLSVIKSNYSSESAIELVRDPSSGRLMRGTASSTGKQNHENEIDVQARIIETYEKMLATRGSVTYTDLKNEAALGKALKMTETNFKHMFSMLEDKQVFVRGEKSKLIFDQQAYAREYLAMKGNDSQVSYEEI